MKTNFASEAGVGFNGFVGDAIVQRGLIRAIHGWHDGLAIYEYILLVHDKGRCAFRITYEYEQTGEFLKGRPSRGFLAEIVYGEESCPTEFFPPPEIAEFAVATIKQHLKDVGIFRVTPAVQNAIRASVPR